VKIKYLLKQLDYGEYQAGRVIWIRTLKDELLIKLNVLDKDGVILYRITEPPESDSYEIEQKYLTAKHLEVIEDFIKGYEPEFECEDEDDITLMLGEFGNQLARRHWLARDSKKTKKMMVDYYLYSTNDYNEERLSRTDYLDSSLTMDEVIEKHLLPKMIEADALNKIDVTIAEAGEVNSYQVMIEEVEGWE